ncbi:hypothetical protein C6Q15_28080 [Burkholderia multivorans]|uniref:Uncharacterized protein n=1 Tax=Burkholderia multivorans TaxID=87883 RepID=A0A2S9MBG7_9BURK|nr:hypothetical protein C6Q05_22800 [Burkholderia multivorans]PRF08603.1 hypothetical protein C6Q07_10880 [Burkholderia multivorans]PRF54628.1 hypothetical protein C6Q15_28080 [Burkholderia multivorans]
MVAAAPSNSSKRAFYALGRGARRRPFAVSHPPSSLPVAACRKLSFDNHSHFDLESEVFHFVMFRTIERHASGTSIVPLPLRSLHVESAFPPAAARRRPRLRRDRVRAACPCGR